MISLGFVNYLRIWSEAFGAAIRFGKVFESGYPLS